MRHAGVILSIALVILVARILSPPFETRLEEFRLGWNGSNFPRVEKLVHSDAREKLRETVAPYGGGRGDWPDVGPPIVSLLSDDHRRVEYPFADGSARLVTAWRLALGSWTVRSFAVER